MTKTTKKPKVVPINPKEPKWDHKHKAPVYTGEFKTKWLPCSPYSGAAA